LADLTSAGPAFGGIDLWLLLPLLLPWVINIATDLFCWFLTA
jgi:hypothetical protein